MSYERKLVLAVALMAMIAPSAASDPPQLGELNAVRLVTGMASGSGSTIGPAGDFYATEGAAGRVLRVDPRTGDVSTFASGLPNSIVGIGGAMDVAFIGGTAYVLVTLVGPDVGGSHVVGIYRVDGPNTFSVIANIGAFSMNNPPNTSFFVPTGVQYALEPYRGGFLVTDGHHNRILYVTLNGEVTELIAFDNIVPTGLSISGSTAYLAQAGPVPHLPEDGKVVSFGSKSDTTTEVASGARLLVDVEFGRGRTLYALSQGVWDGVAEGSPALPNTGALVRVNGDGTFTVIMDGLDRPTSLEFIGNTAYIVTLAGEIWKIDGVSSPPYGVSH
jgi:sugar lactone lactonase YvrE